MTARIAMLTGLLVLLSASAVGACYTQEVREPDATIIICGDPHAVIQLDNTASTVDVTFRVVFWSGKTDVKRVQRLSVDDGDSLTITRFVKGSGRKVSVYDDGTSTLLARLTVNKAAHSGACVRAA